MGKTKQKSEKRIKFFLKKMTNLGSLSISLRKSFGKKCSDKRIPDVFQQRIQRPCPFTDNTGQEKSIVDDDDFGHDDRKSMDDEFSNK